MPGPRLRRDWIFGALFGALLGGVYAFTTQAINWLFLPGIPLAAPTGSLTGYLGQYILLGALLGFITALPDNRLAGMALGGLSAALGSALFSLAGEWGYDSFGRTVVTVLITFMPLVVLMMPLALVIRLGVDAQHPDPSRPYLWARRYVIPAFLTLIAVVVGLLSLYAPDARKAFQYTDAMVRGGLQAASPADLPEPLRDVADFHAKARGPYTLAWSDRVDTFLGPRPAGGELSQFLIIVRFDNGFGFACLFSSNRSVPSCTNY